MQVINDQKVQLQVCLDPIRTWIWIFLDSLKLLEMNQNWNYYVYYAEHMDGFICIQSSSKNTNSYAVSE
jgi:hypothetical protein